MPYSVVKKGSRYHVENKLTGALKGAHQTMEKARKQVQALNANIKEYKKVAQPQMHIRMENKENREQFRAETKAKVQEMRNTAMEQKEKARKRMELHKSRAVQRKNTAHARLQEKKKALGLL